MWIGSDTHLRPGKDGHSCSGLACLPGVGAGKDGLPAKLQRSPGMGCMLAGCGANLLSEQHTGLRAHEAAVQGRPGGGIEGLHRELVGVLIWIHRAASVMLLISPCGRWPASSGHDPNGATHSLLLRSPRPAAQFPQNGEPEDRYRRLQSWPSWPRAQHPGHLQPGA